MSDPKKPSARSSGILLHPSSLPGPNGIGDLGPAAYSFVDALVHARQKWWQILPLGPTAYGDSPYQCFSAFAGNPYLISPQYLLQDGLLDERDLHGVSFSAAQVEYGKVIPFKLQLLSKAWQAFRAGRVPSLRGPFDRFLTEQAGWLDDYALFRALKDANQGLGWHDWPEPARLRQPAYLERARRELCETIGL